MPNENPYLTITLTGRAPVKIRKDDWPVLAQASENDRHGTQIGNQPNREDDWRICVRAHSDERAIVYAVFEHSTLWQGERNIGIRGGELVAAEEDLLQAIKRVAANMADRVNAEQHPGDVFLRLAEECIADLPAVAI